MFLFLPLVRVAEAIGPLAVAALGVLAMLKVSAFIVIVPPPGGAPGGLPDDELGTSIGWGAAFWIVVPRLSNATSRKLMPAISCDFR